MNTSPTANIFSCPFAHRVLFFFCFFRDYATYDSLFCASERIYTPRNRLHLTEVVLAQRSGQFCSKHRFLGAASSGRSRSINTPYAYIHGIEKETRVCMYQVCIWCLRWLPHLYEGSRERCLSYERKSVIRSNQRNLYYTGECCTCLRFVEIILAVFVSVLMKRRNHSGTSSADEID